MTPELRPLLVFGLRLRQLFGDECLKATVVRNAPTPVTRAREFRALMKARVDLRCDDLLCLCRETAKDEDFTWNGRTARIRLAPIEQ